MECEGRIDGFLRARDLRAAATLSIETYGPEVLGFFVTFLRDEQDASDVFSQACEDLWKGLPRFEGRSSFRTWFYTLARHAASRFRRSRQRDRRARLPLSEIDEVAEQVRSSTLAHLRNDVKDRFAAIRDALDKDGRALLVLRVDRDMPWDDIARVFAAGDESDEARARVGARMRKRFQLLKKEIRKRAREAGLLPEDEP
jgi:RNA polymerase sigma-70 factor (ECF subfamily)